MKKLAYYFGSVMVALAAVTLFSCESNYGNVQKLRMKDNLPAGETTNAVLYYTDSGKVVAHLKASKVLRFTNQDYPYNEFPEGVEVHFFEDGQESIVTSKYAIQYDETGLVDLRDSVVLNTADGNVLKAQQLYWDQSAKWVFTDQPYRITFNDGSYNDGGRFDANEDFSVFLSRKNDGVQLVDQNKVENEDNE